MLAFLLRHSACSTSTISPMNFRYMSGLELATLLRDGAADVLVVDVRDLDRAGGHIRGSVNIYASDFVRNAQTYARQWTSNPPKKVVFHCMYSQQRAPTSAQALADAVQNLKITMNPPTPYVLTGGFRTFANNVQFKDLLEGYNE